MIMAYTYPHTRADPAMSLEGLEPSYRWKSHGASSKLSYKFEEGGKRRLEKEEVEENPSCVKLLCFCMQILDQFLIIISF